MDKHDIAELDTIASETRDTREEDTPAAVCKNPIYTTKTIYTRERLLRFNYYHALSKKGLLATVAITTVFILLTFIFDTILYETIDSTLLILLILALVLDATYLIMSFVVPRFATKNAIGLEGTICGEFYHDRFVLDAKTATVSERSENSYAIIKKVRASKEDIYLYISAEQAFVIAKDGISPADLDGFLAHLRARVSERAFKGFKK